MILTLKILGILGAVFVTAYGAYTIYELVIDIMDDSELCLDE